MSIINNKRVAQTAKNPGKMGRGQNQTVPTHEGSMLGEPTVAQETDAAMPADKQAQ